MRTNRNVIAGLSLVAISVYLISQGISDLPHGRVAGGNIIWVLLFGGALLLGIVGIVLLSKSHIEGLRP